MFVARQVLIITPDVSYSIQAQKALQRDGEFVVHSFIRAGEALDFLKENPQDVALVDFRVQDMLGQRVVHHIRSLQPNIAVILAPDTATTRGFKKENDLQAVIKLPYPLRKLVTLLRNAAEGDGDNHADTDKSPAQMVSDDETLMRNYTQTLEFWVTDDDTGQMKLAYPTLPDADNLPNDSETRTFQQLAAEEPPMPSFEEGSTVHDLAASLTNPDTRQRVLNALGAADTGRTDLSDETAPAADDEFLNDRGDSPAMLILETAIDQTTSIKTFSLSEFMTRVQERRLPGEALILPLPSWVEESERYVKEPDFLKESLPGFGEPLEYTSSTTVPHTSSDTQTDPGGLVTDPIKPVRRSHPPDTLPETLSEPESEPEPDSELSDSDATTSEPPLTLPEMTLPQPPKKPPTLPEEQRTDTPSQAAPQPETDSDESDMPYVEHIDGDPRVAQMALLLTQVSLEVAADATLLARGGQLVAYAGKLPRQDIDALRAQVDDWETEAHHSRIRFLTLPGTSTDYMLYSRRTADNLTLSLVFAGDLPLSTIRRQSQRLAEALESVPETTGDDTPQVPVRATDPAADIEPEVDVDTWYPATYLWLLQDPNGELPADAMAYLQHELQRHLLRLGWQIDTLHIEADMVYLYADVPDNDDRAGVIDELMTHSATLLHERFPALAVDSLWADSYFVLHPGRALSVEERQRFVNFARG